MKKLAAVIVVAGAAALCLAGCSSKPSDSDVQAACVDKVSTAVVKEWEDTHNSNVWDVKDAKGTSVQTNSQSDAEVNVYDVAGTAVVEINESGSKTAKASWTCFAQYRNDDKRVSAAINGVTID
jgi:ABC-type glycerol-3-phosphate transport system substrate-binding protein